MDPHSSLDCFQLALSSIPPLQYHGIVAIYYDRHPLKEMFELKVGSSVTVQFPPALHFGQVIKDMTLLPKALFDGLNQMMEDRKKQRKKGQLLSIKCVIPFLDISLMDYDPDFERSSGTNIQRDECCILLNLQKFQ